MLKAFLKTLLIASLLMILAGVIWTGIRIKNSRTLVLTVTPIEIVPTIASPTPAPTTTATLTPSPTAILPTATLTFAGETIIGYSVANRPITVYHFGDGAVNRLIIGGIHGGNETNTVQLAEKLISHITANPQIIPPDITLYILPVLNPDGYERGAGSKGRANENGVDINRNFDAFWALDWPREGCWNYGEISAGTAPESEPEAHALEAFLLDRRVEALISYHSAALGIFAGGQPPDSNSVSLAKALHSVSPYAYPPVETGCKYTGQLIDWASMHNIAAVDIELATSTEMDFKENAKILVTFLNWRR